MQAPVAVAFAAALIAFQPAPAPQPQPPPATAQPATGAPPTSAPPTAGPTPGGTPSPATAGAAPSPAGTPTYRYIYVPSTPPGEVDPPGTPAIREIDLSDQTLVTPGQLRVRVVTTPDVVSVIARTMGRELNLPSVGPGQFGFVSYVPAVPFYLKRTYPVDFVAAVSSGKTAIITLQLSLR